MKQHSSAILMLGIVLLTWTSTFWTSRSRAISRWKVEHTPWLHDVSQDIVRQEEAFKKHIQQYKQSLNKHREELSQLLDDPQSSDETILEKTDLISQTHTDLVRAVGEHLTLMGDVLPDSQKRLLRQFCLQAMSSHTPQRNRYGRQEQFGSKQQPPPGSRMKNRFGQRQRRGHCGLTRKLELTDEQFLIAQQKDPDFETDICILQKQLLTERYKLCTLLEQQQTSAQEISQQIECVLTAHNELEKRLITYVLTMREHFTPQQQKQIITLCQRQHVCPDNQCQSN